MGAPAKRGYTTEDYWAVEQGSSDRHELLHGTITAMAGGSARHNEVASNVLLAFGAFRSMGCHPLGADQRIRVSAAEYTYADVSLFCGKIEIAPGNPPDTATNPKVLVEVLSDKTRGYDTTDKQEMYRRIPSLQVILLVEPERVEVTRWAREGDGWTASVVTDLAGGVEVFGRVIPLAEIYARPLT